MRMCTENVVFVLFILFCLFVARCDLDSNGDLSASCHDNHGMVRFTAVLYYDLYSNLSSTNSACDCRYLDFWNV